MRSRGNVSDNRGNWCTTPRQWLNIFPRELRRATSVGGLLKTPQSRCTRSSAPGALRQLRWATPSSTWG
eukprot:4990841-Lingulodinium_polyedra.AAC.1